MEGLTPHNTHLKNLHHQAGRLTSAGLSLITLFAEEANRLNREDEASRLKALCSSIRQQLDLAKRSEDSASYAHSKANLIFSLGGLAASGIIKMTSDDKLLLAISGRLFNNPAGKQCPFGMVLICIGPKGLPDDVGVVSISELARESNREESKVINDLQERGYLLLNEKTFSLLIDRLVADVREGRLRLPISREKLSQITL